MNIYTGSPSLPFSPILFFKSDEEQEILTATSTGSIDVDAFIDGQEKFWIEDASNSWQKRPLVICDVALYYGSEDCRKAHLTLLNELLQQGFEFFIWQAGKIVPLTQLKSLEDKEFAATTLPAKEEDLLKALDPSLNYGMLDYLTLRELLSGKRTANLNDFFSNNIVRFKGLSNDPRDNNKYCDFYISLYQQKIELYASPEPYRFEMPFFGKGFEYLIEMLTNQLEPSSEKIKIAVVSHEDFEKIYKQDFSELSELYPYGDLRPEDLMGIILNAPKLTTLNLSAYHTFFKSDTSWFLVCERSRNLRHFAMSKAGIPSRQLGMLLASAKDLEELVIDFFEDSIGEFENSFTLPKLKKLSAVNAKFTEAQWNQLHSATPSVEELHVSDIPNSKETFERLRLTSLKRLVFKDSSITFRLLCSFLKTCLNLQELTLSHHNGYSLVDNIAFNLPNLKTFKAIFSSFTYQQLAELWRNAPNLEQIELICCSNLRDILHENYQLPRLKKLYFSNSNLTIPQLEQILHAAPNLETLRIECCRNLNGVWQNGFRLHSLKLIDFSCSPLALNNLHGLVVGAPNLNYLHLSSCDLSKGSWPTEIKFPNLRKIYVGDNTTSIPAFAQVIETMPYLDELHIDYTHNLGAWIEGLNPSRLRHFSATYRGFSLSQLLQIAHRAPYLETLDISNLEILNAAWPPNLRFSRLKVLKAEGSKLSSSLLSQILKSAPLLEELHVSECKELKDEAIEKFCLPYLKKLDAKKSSLSAQLISQLVESAPALEILNLTMCHKIKGVWPNPLHLPHLTTLQVSDSYITFEQLEQIKKSAPSLNKIAAMGCPYLPDSSTQSIKIEPMAAPSIQSDNNAASLTEHKVFYDRHGMSLDARMDRKKVYEDLRLQEAPNDLCQLIPFTKYEGSLCSATPAKSEEELLEKWKNTSAVGYKFYYGVADLKPTKVWQILPSLSANEEITDFYFPGKLILKRSEIQGVHLIAADASASQLKFIVKVPVQALSTTLPPEFKSLLNEIRSFNNTPFTVNPALKTGAACLEDVRKQSIGGCLWRSLLAYYLIKKKDPNYPVRIVKSDTHAFIEIKNKDNYWVKIDLYGLKSIVTTLDNNRPKNLPNITTSLSLKATASKPLLDYLIKLNQPKTASLVLVDPCYKISSLIYSLPPKISFDPKFSYKDTLQGSLAIDISQWDEEAIETFIQTNLPTKHTLIVLCTSEKLLDEELKSRFDLRVDIIEESKEKPVPSTPKTSAEPQTQPTPPLSQNKERALNYTIQNIIWNSASFTTAQSFTFQRSEGIPENFSEFQEKYILPGKNTLHEFASPQEESAFIFWLFSSYPDAYYIDKPEQLRCSRKWIERKGDVGYLRPGPGGKLHDFLTDPKQKRPLILINFSQFKDEDYVQFNSNFESDTACRKADGTPIPKECALIGVRVSRPTAYRGKDFLDRFHERTEITPFDVFENEDAHLFSEKTSGSLKIDLYHSPDFLPRLLGKWMIDKDHYVYKTGALEKALKKGAASLEITRAPWHLSEFRHFWQQLLLKREVILPGKTLKIPANFSVCAPSSSAPLPLQLPFTETLPNGAEVHFLNPSQFGKYFSHQAYKKGLLHKVKGLIKDHTGKPLYVYLSQDLLASQWARLLECCRKYNVNLQIYNPKNKLPLREETIITTSDRDYTVARLLKKRPEAKVFDISESSPNVLQKLDVNWKDEIHFDFKRIYGALWKALNRGEEVILTGEFSPSLTAALLPLCLTEPYLNTGHKRLPFSGRVTLVMDSTKGFEIFDCPKKEEPSIEEKCALLNLRTNVEADIPFYKLKQITSPAPLRPEFEDDEHRLKQVNHALKRAQHVLIEGSSGVGKTTFIQNVLAKDPGYALFFDPVSWARARLKDKTALLVIDEYNLQGSHFSFLEGLYHPKPGILYGGAYFNLKPYHKVIFLGNPMSYGSGRRAVKFLERHNNTILFAPFSVSYISNFLSRFTLSEAAKGSLLKVYQKTLELSPNEVILTLRELEMMALMGLNNALQLGLYFITQGALPQEKQAEFCEWFKKEFSYSPPLVSESRLENYLLTPSRNEAFHLLKAFLAVRTHRLSKHQVGGLGGLIFEGDSGDGKSQLIAAFLKTEGFKELSLSEIGTKEGHYFCYLSASMPLKEKKEAMIKAFHTGIIVIEEEINSSSFFESLRNDLLMHIPPKGHPAPKNLGFMLIGTQNPAKEGGRKEMSPALKHRTLTYCFPSYSRLEQKKIVQQHFPSVTKEEISLMINRAYASTSLRTQLIFMEKRFKLPSKTIVPLLTPTKQYGPTCKLYALSYVMQRLSPYALPARKTKSAPLSLRSVAKQMGFSCVGEIYNRTQLLKLAQSQGFNQCELLVASPETYVATLRKILDAGDTPIVIFDVDKTHGTPLLAGSDSEHAAALTGYFEDFEGNLFFLAAHWGKYWVFNASTLASSANNLLETRPAESFYKIDGLWRQQGDLTDREKNDFATAVEAKTYTQFVKAKDGEAHQGFKNTILVVK